MDGMTWFGRNEADALAQKATERKALLTAFAMTAASIVLAIGVVLALSAMNLRPVMGEEFPAAQAAG